MFDEAIFDPVIFDTPAVTGHPGHHWPRRPTLRVTVEPEDADEAALLILLLRHRFRI